MYYLTPGDITTVTLKTDLQCVIVTSVPGCERADYNSTNQNASHLIRLWSGNEIDQHLSRSDSVHTSQASWVCSRPRRHYKQSVVAVSSHCHTLSFCYYQLRQLHPDIRLLTADAAKTLVQAFITWCLNYCNLDGISNYLMQKVQSIQNATTCLITGTPQCEHITQVLRKLYWLPVHQRVEFKLACLVHQLLAGQTP